MNSEQWVYGPSTYWFWSRIPTLEEIERQVEQMARAGYRTFLIQARLSLPLEQYLSPAYLEAYRQAVACAARLGLQVGIYDDYNWMSGHAGGRTVLLNPAVRERCLFWSQASILNGQAAAAVSAIHSLMYEGWSPLAMTWAYQDGQLAWADWRIFKALVVPHDAHPLDWAAVQDVTPLARLEGDAQGCWVTLELPDERLDGCDLLVWVHAECASSRMVNYLHPETAHTFIQAGLEPYAHSLGEYFGTTIAYTFFDHPYGGFYTWEEKTGALGNSLMFTADLPQVFAQERGYPLEQALLSFIQDLGADSPRLRCDFFETYGALGRQRYFGPLAEWVHAHHLLQAGHELLGYVGAWGVTEGFASIDVRTNFGADYFAIDRFKDIATIDACNYIPQAGPHFGASVARANGKKGCMVEQYVVSNNPAFSSGVGNWGLTPAALFRQGLRFLIQGASHWINHSFYLEDGEPGDTMPLGRRFDFPPGLNFEPWFRYHPKFAELWNALSAFIQQRDETVEPRVALLYPLRTYWDEGSQGLFSQHCAAWFRYLDRMGISFDLIDESQLAAAQIQNGCLVTPYARYAWLILPSVSVLANEHSLEQFAALLAAGGTVLQSGTELRATQAGGELSEAARTRWGALSAHARWLRVEDLAAQLCDATLARWANLGAGGPFLLPDADCSGQTWFKRYPAAYGWDTLVFNDSDHPQRVEIAYPSAVEPFRVDVQQHSLERYSFSERGQSGSICRVDLQPSEWRVLAFKPVSGRGLRLAKAPLMVLEAGAQGQELTVRMLGNGRIEFGLDIYTPANLALRSLAVETWSAGPLAKGRQSVQMRLAAWAHKRPINGPWNLSVDGIDLRLNDLSASWGALGLERYKGAGTYTTAFELSAAESACAWALVTPEYRGVLELSVNGQPVGAPVVDQGLVCIPAECLRAGRNELRLTTVNTADAYYYSGTPYQALAENNSGRIGSVWLYPLIDCTFTFNPIPNPQEEHHAHSND